MGRFAVSPHLSSSQTPLLQALLAQRPSKLHDKVLLVPDHLLAIESLLDVAPLTLDNLRKKVIDSSSGDQIVRVDLVRRRSWPWKARLCLLLNTRIPLTLHDEAVGAELHVESFG